MEIPDTLRAKMEMFRANGRLLERQQDLFQSPSWIAVLLGQGVDPLSYDSLTAGIPAREAAAALTGMAQVIRQTAEAMPTHQQYLACYASQGARP
jgi:tryptophan halogenase